jgi:hypothetical protein
MGRIWAGSGRVEQDEVVVAATAGDQAAFTALAERWVKLRWWSSHLGTGWPTTRPTAATRSSWSRAGRSTWSAWATAASASSAATRCACTACRCARYTTLATSRPSSLSSSRRTGTDESRTGWPSQ